MSIKDSEKNRDEKRRENITYTKRRREEKRREEQ